MSFSISGKTAIVTGAANGVGLAIARHFTEAGANVMFADMDEERLEAEVAAIAGEDQNAKFFAGDLRERLTLANLLSATIDAFDRVDILVNASRQVMTSDPLNIKEDAFDQMLQQNVVANLRLCQLIANRFIQQADGNGQDGNGVGSIVNITSIASRHTHAELLSFSVANAALDQLTRSLAVSLAPHGIRVNAVALGSVMSASLQNALKDNDEIRKKITQLTPLGKIGEASEVAEAVQYLASDGSAFVTGQILAVDGGRTLIDPVDSPLH